MKSSFRGSGPLGRGRHVAHRIVRWGGATTAAVLPIAFATHVAASRAITRQSARARPLEFVYVSNEAGRTLSVIDPTSDSAVATIPIGTRPRGVHVGPDGRYVFVALSGSPRCPPTMPDTQCATLQSDRSKDGIAMVDAATRRVVRVLPGGIDPEQFAVSPDGRHLYVSNEDAGVASVVDVNTGRVDRTVAVGREPEGARTSLDGRTVYITSETESTVTAFDAATGKILSRVVVDKRPRDIVVTADDRQYFVSAEVGGSVSLVDAQHGKVITRIPLPSGAKPMGLALSPDGARLYVSTGRGGTVDVVDTKSRKLVGSVRVGPRPWGLSLTADGRRLYVANGPSNTVSVVDTRTLRVTRTIPVGDSPWGVAIGPAPVVP